MKLQKRVGTHLRGIAIAALVAATAVTTAVALQGRNLASVSPQAAATTGASGPTPTSPATESSAHSATPSAGAPSGDQPVAAFLGDSFTEGAGASSVSLRWTSLLSDSQGWVEENDGHANTGYAKAAQTNQCTAGPCPNFAELASRVVADQPDVVVIAGGANDVRLDFTVVLQAVDDTIATLRQGLPDARIVVVNPWWTSELTADALELSTLIAEHARDAGAEYHDIGQPLLEAGMVTEDGRQANDQGHAAIAARLSAALTRS